MRHHNIVKFSVVFLLAATIIITNGCVSHHAATDLPVRRPLGSDLPTFQAGVISKSQDTVTILDEPMGPLSLKDAWAIALMRNADLAAFSWEIRAAEAKRLQASQRPNPEVGVDFENIFGSGPFSGWDEAESTVGISQLLELGGKRQRRMRLAQLDTKLAGWDYEKQRVDVLTEVAHAFIEVLVAQRRLELAQQNAELAAQMSEVVDKQIKSGEISPIERDKQKVVTVTSQAAYKRAQRNLTAARHRLAATWGSLKPQFEKAVGDINTISPVPSFQALTDLVSQNPDIARWATEMAQRRASIDLAKAQKVPDLTASIGVRRFNESNDNALVFGISLPMPIFNRYQGEILTAQSEYTKAIEEKKATEVEVKTTLASVYEEMASAYSEAILLRDEALPAAQQSFDKTQEGFRRGQFDYLKVLDAQRTLFETRGQLTDALEAYHIAAVQLEGLIGQSIETIGEIPKKSSESGDAFNANP